MQTFFVIACISLESIVKGDYASSPLKNMQKTLGITGKSVSAAVTSDQYSTRVPVSIGLSGRGLSTAYGIRLLKPGVPCATNQLASGLDTGFLFNCPGACSAISVDPISESWITLYTPRGDSLDCDERMTSCRQVAILNITVLTESTLSLQFNASISSTLRLGDMIVIDPSTIICLEPGLCALISGTVYLNGSTKPIPGHRITGFQSSSEVNVSVESFDLSPFLTADFPKNISTPILAWEITNRASTKVELARLTSIRNSQVCLYDPEDGSMIPAGTITFSSPPMVGPSILQSDSAASAFPVTSTLHIPNLNTNGNLKIVIPSIGVFDLPCNDPACLALDGTLRPIACDRFLADIFPSSLGAPVECLVASFSSLRKEFLVKFNPQLTIVQDITLVFHRTTVSETAVNPVGELHILDPSNKNKLLQFGEIFLGFQPKAKGGKGGSIELSSNTSDLRLSNGSLTATIAGAAAESAGITNGTVIRIVGISGKPSVTCGPTSNTAILFPRLSCSILVMESVNNASVSLLYMGPTIWGSIKIKIMFTYLPLPASGFWPKRFLAEFESPEGALDLTWSSEKSLLWCSPSPGIVVPSLEASGRVFAGGLLVLSSVKIGIPWPLIGGSRIAISHPGNIALNETEIEITDLTTAHVSIPVTVRALFIDESVSGSWNVTISSGGASFVSPFLGSVLNVVDSLRSVRVSRVSMNKILLQVHTGFREWISRYRRSLRLIKRIPWSGRRSCLAISSLSGTLSCEINTGGELVVYSVNFFLEPDTLYSFEISVLDERFFTSGFFDVVLADHAGVPMEGLDNVLIGFPSLIDEPCVDATAESTNGIWYPGHVGRGRVTVRKVRADAWNMRISLPGSERDSDVIERDSSDIEFDVNVTSDSWIVKSLSITFVCLSQNGTVIGNSRIGLPFTASLSELYVIRSAIRFTSDFGFRNVTLCDPSGTCADLQSVRTSPPGSYEYNFSFVNNSAPSLSLFVDSLKEDIPNPYFPVLKPLARFSVHLLDLQRPFALNRISVSIIPTSSCPKCNLTLTAPPGFTFLQECTSMTSNFAILSCIGNLDKLWIETASTIHTYSEVNFTLPVMFSKPDAPTNKPALWRIVVGNSHLGEIIQSDINLAMFNNITVKNQLNSFSLGSEINTIEVRFIPTHLKVDILSLDIGPGFVIKSARPSFQASGINVREQTVTFMLNSSSWNISESVQSIFLCVVNPKAPPAGNKSNWTLASYHGQALIDLAIITPPTLVGPMDSISVQRTTDLNSLVVEFQTSLAFEFGDSFNIIVPYPITCGRITVMASQELLVRQCVNNNFSLNLATRGVVMRNLAFIQVKIIEVNFPASTPLVNIITVSHVRLGRLLAEASTLGPLIQGTIWNATVELGNPETKFAGGSADLSVSFDSSTEGSFIDVIAISPIGFDFRGCSEVDGHAVTYLGRDRIRVSKRSIPQNRTRITLNNVILSPSSGFGVFNISLVSDNSGSLITQEVANTMFVPTLIDIDSISFEPVKPLLNLPPRFGDGAIRFFIQTNRATEGFKMHVELESFLNASFSQCSSVSLCGTIVPPNFPVPSTDIYLHAVTNDSRDIVTATIGVKTISLLGKIANRFTAFITAAPGTRYPPLSEVEVVFNISCTGCVYDSVRVIPPESFRVLSVDRKAGLRVTVRTPTKTPIDNTWIIVGSVSQNDTDIFTVWGTAQGFNLTHLEATSIVYPALPSEQVVAPVLLAASFRLSYPSLIIRTVRMQFTEGRFRIQNDMPVIVRYLPVANWRIDSGGSALSLSLNDSLTARDYAFGLMITGPPFNGNYSISLQLLDEHERVVDASFIDVTPTVQFGIPIAPKDPTVVFSRDDQSSSIQQNWNLTTQESSSIQIAQLSSFREVFRFRVFREIKVKTISRIDILFPANVRHNPIWSRIDPIFFGVASDHAFQQSILAVEIDGNLVSLSMNTSWVDKVGTEFDISVPVILPQTDPLPAFNFFTVTFRNSSNYTLLNYVFSGHTRDDETSFEISNLDLILAGNTTSGEPQPWTRVLWTLFCLISILF